MCSLPFLVCFPSVKEGSGPCAINLFCMCPPIQFLNQLIDFHEVWYECYAIGGHPSHVMFNFL
jgi:hypothetical protein